MTIKIEENEVQIKVGDQMKTIGQLRNKVLYVSRRHDKHLMKNLNSYGFSKKLIEENFFDHLHIKEYYEGKVNNYLIERTEIFTIGRYYQAPEFEKQIFVDWNTLQNYKIE